MRRFVWGWWRSWWHGLTHLTHQEIWRWEGVLEGRRVKVRVCVSLGNNRRAQNWTYLALWKEFDFPIPPFVGMEIDFPDIDEAGTVERVKVMVPDGIVIVFTSEYLIDCKGRDGWSEAGLWDR